MQPLPNDSWYYHKSILSAYARTFDPAAKLALKESCLWVGGLKTNATTFGRTVYIAPHWTASDVERSIPHEVKGHVKQFRYCGLGIHPELGYFGMLLLYVWGVILPVLLAWGRYRCELHADTKSWEYHLKEKKWSPNQVRDRAEKFGKIVFSGAYVYAWPWALWGFKRRAEKVIRKHIEEGR